MGCGSSSAAVKIPASLADAEKKKEDVRPASPAKKVADKSSRRVSFGEDVVPRVVSDKESHAVVRETRALSQNVVQENFDRDIREFYSISWRSELGSGVNGSVRLCKHRITGVTYAMKTLSKKYIKPEKYISLKDEIKIMQDIDHPHILRIHEYFETPEHIYLVSELCTGGELYTRLVKQTDSMYSEQTACRYVSVMLGAIAFLHAHGIVHRDLKLENFLFETLKENSSLKLIDFGLSRLVVGDEKLTGAVGSSYYVAPEVLSGKQYDAKCDVWSIGVIAYMLLSGVPPFDGDSDRAIFKSVRSGNWSFTTTFQNISPEAKSFIQRCLVVDPAKRMSAKDALKHPWFRMLTFAQTSVNVAENVILKIMDFSNRNKISKLFMEVMAYTMQPGQLEDIKKQFIKMDVSKSGRISFEDLRRALRTYVDDAKTEEIFREIDYSNTGFINYHEFIAAVMNSNCVKEENMKLAFDMISNHNDHFTGEDISNLLGAQSSTAEVDSILATVNLNSAQKIHYRTFRNLLDVKTELAADTMVLEGGRSTKGDRQPPLSPYTKVPYSMPPLEVSVSMKSIANTESTDRETSCASPDFEEAQAKPSETDDWLSLSLFTAPIVGIASYLPSFTAAQ
jgi:calcium-dependent protein kinase